MADMHPEEVITSQQPKQPGKIWSASVIAVFSIVFSPIVGVVLGAINYKRVGRLRRGVYLAIGFIAGLLVVDAVGYFFLSNYFTIISFIAALLVTVGIIVDQKNFYDEYEKTHPDKKPRSWWSAVGVMIIEFAVLAIVIVLISLIFVGFGVSGNH